MGNAYLNGDIIMKEEKDYTPIGAEKFDYSMYDNLRVNGNDSFKLFQLYKYKIMQGSRLFIKSSTLTYSIGVDIEKKNKYKKEYLQSVISSIKHLKFYLKICGSNVKYCEWYPGNVFTEDVFIPNKFFSGINIYNCSFNFNTEIQLKVNIPYYCIVENTYYTKDRLIEDDLITMGLHGKKEMVY